MKLFFSKRFLTKRPSVRALRGGLHSRPRLGKIAYHALRRNLQEILPIFQPYFSNGIIQKTNAVDTDFEGLQCLSVLI